MIRLTRRLHGEIGLWLIVIFDAYETILRNGCQHSDAGSFLFEANGVFDAVAAALDYDDPEILRQRIRDSLLKKKLQGQNEGRSRRKTTAESVRTGERTNCL